MKCDGAVVGEMHDLVKVCNASEPPPSQLCGIAQEAAMHRTQIEATRVKDKEALLARQARELAAAEPDAVVMCAEASVRETEANVKQRYVFASSRICKRETPWKGMNSSCQRSLTASSAVTRPETWLHSPECTSA